MLSAFYTRHVKELDVCVEKSRVSHPNSSVSTFFLLSVASYVDMHNAENDVETKSNK